jgi:sugar phosphate isomerase/epimerase
VKNVRVAISGIAWDVTEDDAIAQLLRARGVGVIDVAPGKYFPDPQTASDARIQAVRKAWADRGISVHGMQALLFGTSGLNLFAAADVQETMLDRLDAVCRIGAGLGAGPLVFGSPKNRDRSGLDDAQTDRIAVDFFRRLGDRAARHGVTICLEPNPERYGCNFMTRTDEAARMVRLVDHPAIRMQFDSGTVTINGEDVAALLERHHDVIGHVHASEPDLVTLGTGGTDHQAIGAVLRRWLPDATVSIEMAGQPGINHAPLVVQAVELALRCYGAPGPELPR